MSGEQQQAAPQSQNAIMAAAGRFKDVVANLLKEVSSCRSSVTMGPIEHKSTYFREDCSVLSPATPDCQKGTSFGGFASLAHEPSTAGAEEALDRIARPQCVLKAG